MVNVDDDEFSILHYDEFVTTTTRGMLFRVDGKDYWIPKSMVGEIDEKANTVEVKQWYYDKYFL